MELRNKATGGVFSCDDEMGNRLLAEGGYEKVSARLEQPSDLHKPAVKRSPRKVAGG